MAASTQRVYSVDMFQVMLIDPNGRRHSFFCEADTMKDALAAPTGYPDGTRVTAIRLCIPATDLEQAIEEGF